MSELFGDVIHCYTSEDAHNDGIHIDVSEMGKEAGFKWPVRITVGVQSVVEPSPKAKEYGQDFQGRLWDVLWMAFLAAKKSDPNSCFMKFSVIFQNGPGNRNRKTVDFYAAIDTTAGYPVIVIMLPEEY